MSWGVPIDTGISGIGKWPGSAMAVLDEDVKTLFHLWRREPGGAKLIRKEHTADNLIFQGTNQ